MTFAGIPSEAFAWFEAVAADTTWETAQANRLLWERAVHEPIEALTEELADEFGRAKVYNLHRSPELWVVQYAYVEIVESIELGVTLSLDGLGVEGGWLISDRG